MLLRLLFNVHEIVSNNLDSPRAMEQVVSQTVHLGCGRPKEPLAAAHKCHGISRAAPLLWCLTAVARGPRLACAVTTIVRPLNCDAIKSEAGKQAAYHPICAILADFGGGAGDRWMQVRWSDLPLRPLACEKLQDRQLGERFWWLMICPHPTNVMRWRKADGQASRRRLLAAVRYVTWNICRLNGLGCLK